MQYQTHFCCIILYMELMELEIYLTQRTGVRLTKLAVLIHQKSWMQK